MAATYTLYFRDNRVNLVQGTYASPTERLAQSPWTKWKVMEPAGTVPRVVFWYNGRIVCSVEIGSNTTLQLADFDGSNATTYTTTSGLANDIAARIAADSDRFVP